MTTPASVAPAAMVAAPHQITMPTMILLVFLILVLLAFAWHLWQRHRQAEYRRRHAESDLRLARRAQEHLSGLLPIALFSYEPRLGFVAVSDGIARLLPVNPERLLSSPTHFMDHIAPDFHAPLGWLAELGDCPNNFEWLGCTTSIDFDGKVRWLQMRTAHDLGPRGQPRVAGMLLDVTELKHAQISLELSREDLRRLARHRENERESEYRRLAREFHDELGQLLTGARLRLQLLERIPNGEADKAIGEIDTILGDAYRSIKSIATELRPPALNLGLAAAIEWQAQRTLLPAKLGFTAALRTDAESLPDAAKTSLFRIAQESFTNIVRYAKAVSVHVSLRMEGADYLLEISDDGVGFNLDLVDRHTHFGLSGMRERALALGGDLDIDSAPGEGTRIHVRVPSY